MSKNIVNNIFRDAQRASQESGQATAFWREVTPLEYTAEPTDRLLMIRDPYDPRCEKIRTLRTDLLLRRESTDRASLVALLSPCSGDGRSMLAAELAIAFAQTGRPTLLVDADLRRPQQHLLFGTDNRKGLSQAIEHGAKPQLHNVRGLPRMSVLTAGDVPPNPLELLSSQNFASMVEDWRNDFEFVVIDTAPIMNFSDALMVANLVGRGLVLCRADRTSYKHMGDTLRRLAATRLHIVGAVISHF